MGDMWWGAIVGVSLMTGFAGLVFGLIVGHYTGRRAERKYVTCNYANLMQAKGGVSNA